MCTQRTTKPSSSEAGATGRAATSCAERRRGQPRLTTAGRVPRGTGSTRCVAVAFSFTNGDSAYPRARSQPMTLFTRAASPPARKLSRRKLSSRSTPASPRPSGDYTRPTSPTPTEKSAPRKLRRKSHGAYYASASPHSPPASPVTSYAYANGHSISPRRLPGQFVASPRASRDYDEREPSPSQLQSRGVERAPVREEKPREVQAQPQSTATTTGLRAPTFGPYVCELEDQDDEVTPQDRHYVARMLAKCVVPPSLTSYRVEADPPRCCDQPRAAARVLGPEPDRDPLGVRSAVPLSRQRAQLPPRHVRATEGPLIAPLWPPVRLRAETPRTGRPVRRLRVGSRRRRALAALRVPLLPVRAQDARAEGRKGRVLDGAHPDIL